MAQTVPPDQGYVVLTEEPNAMRAHWVAGAVEAAGIPTFVDEDLLADEFAVSQRVMGLLRVRVLVPAARLDEARTVFLGLSQPIPLVDEEEDEDADASADDGRWTAGDVARVGLWIALVLLAVLAVAGLLHQGRAPPDDAPGAPPRPPTPLHPPPRLPPPLHR